MTKGFIMIATHHHYYGEMAYNLALTIKANDKNAQIALVYDEGGIAYLTEKQLDIFDKKIPVTGTWRQTRFSIPDITPFDQTCFMDADQAWLSQKPMDVFDLLKETNFTCVNEGYYDVENNIDNTSPYMWGTDLPKLLETYKIKKGKFWKVRGEFFLFKKQKKIADMFRMAGEMIADPKVSVGAFGTGTFTEWAFDVAMHKTGLHCHAPLWRPSFWPVMYPGNKKPLWELNQKFLAISAGGSNITQHQKYIYDLVVSGACHKFGIQHLYPLRPKKSYIPERKVTHAKVSIQ